MKQSPGSRASSRMAGGRASDRFARRAPRLVPFAMLLLPLASCSSEQAPQRPATTQPMEARPIVREASRGPVKATWTIDRDAVVAPDTLTATLRVDAELGVEVTIPDFGATLGDFSIRESKDLPRTEDDTTQHVGRVLVLEPVVPGKCDIPEVRVSFADRREKADGSKTAYEDEATLQPATVRVEQNLADMKGPASLPWPRSYRVIAWLLGSVALLAVAALLGRRYLKRRAERLAARPARVVPAHEWALAELDILASEGLIERGRIQEYYYRVNAIVRGYIERRWGLMAGEQTSEEFIRELQRSMFLDDANKLVLRRFTDACDPVKYARQQPTGDEIGWVQTTARQFVVETAARPEPTEAKAA